MDAGVVTHPLGDLSDESSAGEATPCGEATPRGESREDTERLVAALLRRDEVVIHRFLRDTHGPMLRIAEAYVGTRELAEEVVQDAWAAMLRGLPAFERRSSVRTWLFSILIRRARSAGMRERRSQAISQLVDATDETGGDPIDRFFHGEGHPEAGSWALPPTRWRRSPESIALDHEIGVLIGRAIDDLPEMQRLVVILRDVEGWDTAEIATHLDRTRNWVRVVLHRGRFKVRAALEEQLGTRE